MSAAFLWRPTKVFFKTVMFSNPDQVVFVPNRNLHMKKVVWTFVLDIRLFLTAVTRSPGPSVNDGNAGGHSR